MLYLRFRMVWPDRTPRALKIPLLFNKWKVSIGINCLDLKRNSSDLEYSIGLRARLFKFQELLSDDRSCFI